MPRPRPIPLELQRQLNTLSTKLLNANAALRIKTIYCERLEYLLHQRNNRIDELFALLECARQQIRKLDTENKRLATLVATPQQPLLT
jgi:hypothetical protein